jgi:hypothetical protein
MKAPHLSPTRLAALSAVAFANLLTGHGAGPAGNAITYQRPAAGFSAPRCRIPGYAQAVGITEPGRAGNLRHSCLLLAAGQGRFSYEDVERVQALPAAEVCPGLVLLRQHRGGRLEQIRLEIPARSRLREASDCCGFDQLRVRRDRKGLHLQLRSQAPSRDCFGGTARTSLQEIFLLKDTQLLLEKDQSREAN